MMHSWRGILVDYHVEKNLSSNPNDRNAIIAMVYEATIYNAHATTKAYK